MSIGFHSPTLNPRGSCVALYDYANYTETILHYKSIIFIPTTTLNDTATFMKFKNRFKVIFYKGTNDFIKKLLQENCKFLYTISYGKRTDEIVKVSKILPVFIHCVFDMSEPHGEYYYGVSLPLALKFGKTEYLPHILPTFNEITNNFRKELNISENSIVFGRHGGLDTFNIEFAKNVISKIVRQNSNIYFLFVNTPQWDNHSNIIHLPAFTNLYLKQKFIQTCDAMVVPESLGHTFGLAIEEFKFFDKPIICYNGPVWNNNHIISLGKNGIYFSNENELENALLNFKPYTIKYRNKEDYIDNRNEIVKKFKTLYSQLYS